MKKIFFSILLVAFSTAIVGQNYKINRNETQDWKQRYYDLVARYAEDIIKENLPKDSRQYDFTIIQDNNALTIAYSVQPDNIQGTVHTEDVWNTLDTTIKHLFSNINKQIIQKSMPVTQSTLVNEINLNTKTKSSFGAKIREKFRGKFMKTQPNSPISSTQTNTPLPAEQATIPTDTTTQTNVITPEEQQTSTPQPSSDNVDENSYTQQTIIEQPTTTPQDTIQQDTTANTSEQPKPENTNTANNEQEQPAIKILDVDTDIPLTARSKSSENTYVLIIANQDYQYVDQATYAANDGEIFRKYCIRTLGIPQENIGYYPNATIGEINVGVNLLCSMLNTVEDSKAIVYYSGHGISNEQTGEAYIYPIDIKGANTSICYSLNTLYNTLGNTNAKSITYFIDACFTGSNREGNMLINKRNIREAKPTSLREGYQIVFYASKGNETAQTYPEKKHGLFTYFLLKKLQETEGNVSYGDLASYIRANVQQESISLHNKQQTPKIAGSPEVVSSSSSWRTIMLK